MRQIKRTMPQVGKIEWIGLRPAPRETVVEVSEVRVESRGLDGDHFSGRENAPRTVTLIQKEHIEAVASILESDSIDPGLLRRNIVVSGVNLSALKDREFMIGDVVLHGAGDCPPCNRMEDNLGPGGYNAMCGHGGITARVVQSGVIRCGDQVGIFRNDDE